MKTPLCPVKMAGTLAFSFAAGMIRIIVVGQARKKSVFALIIPPAIGLLLLMGLELIMAISLAPLGILIKRKIHANALVLSLLAIPYFQVPGRNLLLSQFIVQLAA
jgi:hypothetical protein